MACPLKHCYGICFVPVGKSCTSMQTGMTTLLFHLRWNFSPFRAFWSILAKIKDLAGMQKCKIKKNKKKRKRKRKRKRWSKGYVRGETKSKKMRIRAIWFIYMWIEEVKIYWKTKWCSGILREKKNMMKIRKLDREHRQWDEKEKINEEFRCGWEDEGINLTWLVTLLEIHWVELPKCFFYFFF